MQYQATQFALAAVDIDDTLLGPDGTLSEANRSAIACLQDRGISVVLASGRSPQNTLPFYHLLGLDGYVVSSGGALVSHPRTGEVLYRQPLRQPDARKVIEDGLTRGMTVLCFADDAVYARREDVWTEQYRRDAGTTSVRIVDPRSMPDHEWLKVIWADHPERLAAIADELARWHAGRLSTVITHPYFFEFTASGVNKAVAISRLADHLGIRRGRVLAFGDGNNDRELLAWAGVGVAMDYGRPAAKAAARLTSPPGDPETALARSVQLIFRCAA